MEGTLSKWTNVMKGWQYRYFVLDDNAGLFSYYTSREKMMRGARRGCVRLRGALVGIDDEDDATFTITVDGKSFYFQARDLEEREKWIRALEDTVLRHNQMRKIGAQPKATRTKWTSGNGEPPKIQDFDKKLAETDSYLQLLLNQVSGLKSKIDLNNSENDLSSAIQDNGDVHSVGDNSEENAKNLRKTRYEDIANKAVGMTESIKHAIVLLQIAKNASAPQSDNEVKTFKSGTSSDLVSQSSYNDAKNDSSRLSASSDQEQSEEVARVNDSSKQILASSLTSEKSDRSYESDIPIGDKMSESVTRNVVIQSEQESSISGSCPQYIDKRKSSIKLAQQTIPDESYESDSDDEFYEANDFVEELDGVKCLPGSSIEESNDRVRPEILEFNESSLSRNEGYPPEAIMSPMTPGIDENDETIDYDKLYENVDDDEDLDMKSHGSVITHLLSQVRIGMDLTKIVLPTFILERRSLLEMYSDFFAHPDLFLEIPDGKSPEDRMVRALKWYLSSFHAGRKSSIAKKPYNPILGETFRCHWKVPPEKCQTVNTNTLNSEALRCPKEVAKESALPECSPDELTFIAEQVSHHPPISAFYAEHVNKKISTCAHIYTKSSFLGMSIGVHNVGEGKISLLDNGEEYVATFPSAYARSILSVPWIELGGKCEIVCSKTGYSASLEFKCKPFFSSDINKVSAEVFAPNVKKPILKVDGEWNGKMMAKWASGKNEVFIDVNKLPTYPKRCKPVAQQMRTESRRLWKNVTYNLKENNIEAATGAKFALEQQQRMDAAKRKEDGTKWETKYFTPEGKGGGEDKWHYNKPLIDRLNSK